MLEFWERPAWPGACRCLFWRDGVWHGDGFGIYFWIGLLRFEYIPHLVLVAIYISATSVLCLGILLCKYFWA